MEPPIRKPVVNTRLGEMNSLQRSAESLRYVLLCLEHGISPAGQLRSWLQLNLRVSAWLLVPALLVMPVVGLILWQLTIWVSMLTGVAGRLVVLILLALVLTKILRALLRR